MALKKKLTKKKEMNEKIKKKKNISSDLIAIKVGIELASPEGWIWENAYQFGRFELRLRVERNKWYLKWNNLFLSLWLFSVFIATLKGWGLFEWTPMRLYYNDPVTISAFIIVLTPEALILSARNYQSW